MKNANSTLFAIIFIGIKMQIYANVVLAQNTRSPQKQIIIKQNTDSSI